MATLGHGTTLSWNSQTVAELQSIGGVSLSADSVEVTTHQSPDRYKEFIQGLIDAGDFPLSGFFKPSDTDGQIAMLTDFNAGTMRECVVTFPAAMGTTWTFNGFLTSYEIGEANSSDGVPFSATIKITGKPTLAVAAVTGMSACGFSNDVLMMPSFAIGTYEYVVTITHGETSTIVTPVDATSGEVITITANGASQTVATGEASSAIAVSASAMTDIIIVISHASKAAKTYTFHCAVLAA